VANISVSPITVISALAEKSTVAQRMQAKVTQNQIPQKQECRIIGGDTCGCDCEHGEIWQLLLQAVFGQ